MFTLSALAADTPEEAQPLTSSERRSLKEKIPDEYKDRFDKMEFDDEAIEDRLSRFLNKEGNEHLKEKLARKNIFDTAASAHDKLDEVMNKKGNELLKEKILEDRMERKRRNKRIQDEFDNKRIPEPDL